MLKNLRVRARWASLKNGAIKIGSGLIQAVISRVSAGLQRIKSQRKSTAAKKKREGRKGKTVVKNTKAAEVQFASKGGVIEVTKAKRPSPPPKKGKIVARGCGKVLSNRRKFTSGSVSA
jgi:hypothetical protein